MRRSVRQLRDFVHCAWALGRTVPQRVAILWRLTKNLRVRLGLARHHPARVYTLGTRYGPVHLRDNFGDVTNLPDLLWRGVYGVRRLAEPGAIVDVGANIGLFALWAAYHNPGRPVLCVEPLPSNVEMIARNCPRAQVRHAGAGRARETARLRVDEHGLMATSLPTAWKTTEAVFQVLPLDEMTREHGIDGVAFLKIDTEGMELEVLDGAPETLRRTHRVALETHGEHRHDGVLERLRNAGFRIEAESRSGRTGFVFASRPADGGGERHG